MKTIPLPERGLTLLPPWPQAIAFSSKRLENRSYGVARQIGSWRGLVLLGQSRGGISKDRTKVDEDVVDSAREIGRRFGWTVPPQEDGKLTLNMLKAGAWAGTVPLIAELVDVLPPERCSVEPWHVPGQWGLILGRVWEVEPVPCTGGVGVWAVEWCVHCGHVYADSSRSPAVCYSCKKGAYRIDGDRDERPMLRVVREAEVKR